jgi:predicted CXXCH cytochrome family protein
MPAGGPRCMFLVAVIAGLLLLHPLSPAQTEPAQYVGSDACSACHEEVAGNIANSAHGQLFRESLPARHGCEACHGPGSNHVNSGGDRTLLFSFKGASGADVSRHCGACHETEPNEAHLHRTPTCLSCHAAHHYRQKEFLLVDNSFRLCTGCHDRL